MALNAQQIKDIFFHLEHGNLDAFFKHVKENVEWTVMGTHPLSGTYHNKKDFVHHTFYRIKSILKTSVMLKVNHIYIEDQTAIIEMESLATQKNGKPFNNVYCWIVRFEDSVIAEVRAYLDSALVQEAIDANESTWIIDQKMTSSALHAG